MPFDPTLGLENSRQSPGLQPLVGLAGTLAPFGKAEDVLRRLAGVRLSGSTCRRRTEEAGQQLPQDLHDGQAVRPDPPASAGDFSLPEQDGQRFAGTVGYLGLDAFAVPVRHPDGPGTV